MVHCAYTSSTIVHIYLKNKEAQKVEVGSSLELLEQVEGNEGEQRVFRCFDEVVLKNKSWLHEKSLTI